MTRSTATRRGSPKFTAILRTSSAVGVAVLLCAFSGTLAPTEAAATTGCPPAYQSVTPSSGVAGSTVTLTAGPGCPTGFASVTQVYFSDSTSASLVQVNFSVAGSSITTSVPANALPSSTAVWQTYSDGSYGGGLQSFTVTAPATTTTVPPTTTTSSTTTTVATTTTVVHTKTTVPKKQSKPTKKPTAPPKHHTTPPPTTVAPTTSVAPATSVPSQSTPSTTAAPAASPSTGVPSWMFLILAIVILAGVGYWLLARSRRRRRSRAARHSAGTLPWEPAAARAADAPGAPAKATTSVAQWAALSTQARATSTATDEPLRVPPPEAPADAPRVGVTADVTSPATTADLAPLELALAGSALAVADYAQAGASRPHARSESIASDAMATTAHPHSDGAGAMTPGDGQLSVHGTADLQVPAHEPAVGLSNGRHSGDETANVVAPSSDDSHLRANGIEAASDPALAAPAGGLAVATPQGVSAAAAVAAAASEAPNMSALDTGALLAEPEVATAQLGAREAPALAEVESDSRPGAPAAESGAPWGGTEQSGSEKSAAAEPLPDAEPDAVVTEAVFETAAMAEAETVAVAEAVLETAAMAETVAVAEAVLETAAVAVAEAVLATAASSVTEAMSATEAMSVTEAVSVNEAMSVTEAMLATEAVAVAEAVLATEALAVAEPEAQTVTAPVAVSVPAWVTKADAVASRAPGDAGEVTPDAPIVPSEPTQVAKPRLPVIEGWFTTDADQPRLIGARCIACSTVVFPPTIDVCQNPECHSSDLEPIELSRRGTIWSCTDVRSQPPLPYLTSEPFEPFAVAAVELTAERIVVLGQVIAGVDAESLSVGERVELVVEPLYELEGTEYMGWRWRPVTNAALRSREVTGDDAAELAPSGDGTVEGLAADGTPLVAGAHSQSLEHGASPHAQSALLPVSPSRWLARSWGNDVVVLGTGMHPWWNQGRSVVEYGRAAALAALYDAGVNWRDIQFVAAGGTLGAGKRGSYAASTFARALGWNGARVASCYSDCASGATAIEIARTRILAGLCDVALVIGADATPDGPPAPVDGEYWDDPDWLLLRLVGATNASYFGLHARRRMDLYGATERDFAAVKVKNTMHGHSNPNARYRKELTIEEVLASPMVAHPLRSLEISSTSAGAAALVLASAAFARRHISLGGNLSAAPIRIRAVSTVTPVFPNTVIEMPELATESAAAGAPSMNFTASIAHAAYDEAGIAPSDIDVAEVYDLSSALELDWYEALGLCPEGEAERLLREGATTIGGRVPVNTSGGLACFGEAVAAQAIAQVCEVVWQLQKRAGGRQVEAAKVGITANHGLFGHGSSVVLTQ
jgi:acetyl-CoA acetyltransferase/uncharacterized OB-fold protein